MLLAHQTVPATGRNGPIWRSHLQRPGFREGFFARRRRKIRLGLGYLKCKASAAKMALKALILK